MQDRNIYQDALEIYKPILDSYVEKLTSNRDKSHGIEHMRKVATNALALFRNDHSPLNTDNYYKKEFMVYAVGILHDAFDRKYDKKGLLRMNCMIFLKSDLEFDLKFESGFTDLIINCIDRVSYSKENELIKSDKSYPYDWLEILGEAGLTARNYVSDADKHDAQNISRCIWYILSHVNPQMIISEIMVAVIKHSKEKLLLLPNFMRTAQGKIIAEKLDKEMRNDLVEKKLLELIKSVQKEIMENHY